MDNMQALLNRIDATKALIDNRRPLAVEEILQLDAYYRIGATYSSNALEGNSLTLSETKVLLEDGLTAGGKPLRDAYEAIGHARAYNFMLEAARSNPFIVSESMVLRLHKLFYQGIEPEKAGVYPGDHDELKFRDYLIAHPEAAVEYVALKRSLFKDYEHNRDGYTDAKGAFVKRIVEKAKMLDDGTYN